MAERRDTILHLCNITLLILSQSSILTCTMQMPVACRYSPVAPDKLPLLVISGGPGLPSSYLEPLELMAGVGRQVIFYDQVMVLSNGFRGLDSDLQQLGVLLD